MRVICYNQYPGLYEDIHSMTEDLPRIAGLGFKQVWINPIYLPCKTNPIPGMADRINCPYAMQDQKISPRYAKDEQAVKNYTKTVSDLKMIPMFDLVARHVAIDHSLVLNKPKWFKRHLNGNLVMHNMDENYNPTSSNPWCDIACFNYDDPQITDEILNEFWEPFLRYNLVDLGFKGIRLDAPLMIPPPVVKRLLEIAKKICVEHHKEAPIVIAETVGIGDEKIILGFKNSGITHAMNSCYWMSSSAEVGEHLLELWREDYNWYTHNKGILQQIGPTVGYAGSHDEPRYVQALLDKGIPNNPIVLASYMKKKIAEAAFSSEGGWILLYGDEFGVREKVNLFNTTPKHYHAAQALQTFDISNYIRSINSTLSQLPDPIFPQWQQRVFLDSYPDLVIFLIHQGEGYSGETQLVITNTSEEKNFILTEETLKEIMLVNGRNENKDNLPGAIFLAGDIFDVDLGQDINWDKIPIYTNFYTEKKNEAAQSYINLKPEIPSFFQVQDPLDNRIDLEKRVELGPIN